MDNRPELPDFYKGRRQQPEPEQEKNIIWQDSDDVYKPICKNIYNFLEERRINIRPQTRVYIKSEALENLKNHLRSDLRVEQGGILFGNAYEDPELGIYVDITAAVAAPATRGSGAHLDFTPHSWTGIMDHAKAQHPDDNIVGWYHSHPNLGVFMSGTDMNTQQAFFYHPWSLSIVHDPCRGDIGFFLGRNAQRVTPVIYDQTPYIIDTGGDQGLGVKGGQYTQERYRRFDDTQGSENTNLEGSGIKWKDERPVIGRGYKNIQEIIQLIILLGILVLIIITLANLLGLSSFMSNGQSNPPQEDPSLYQSVAPFKASFKTLPVSKFKQLSDLNDFDKTYLKYPVIKGGNKIGNGQDVTLLLISPEPESRNSVDSVDLEYQEINLPRDNAVNIRNNSSIFYPSFVDSNHQVKDKTIEDLNLNKGVIFVVYSSTENQEQGYPQRKISNVIYIPRRIKYENKENKQQQTIEIKDIIDNER